MGSTWVENGAREGNGKEFREEGKGMGEEVQCAVIVCGEEKAGEEGGGSIDGACIRSMSFPLNDAIGA